MTRNSFVSEASRIQRHKPDCCHSQYLGIILEGGANYECDSFSKLNDQLESETAKELGVEYYTDGCSIILTYANNRAEEELEHVSDAVYERKFDSVRRKHIDGGWKVMFGLVYDIFIDGKERIAA